jgi:hypothetical protein
MALENPHTRPSTQEKIKVTGSQLLEHAKRLLHEGNIRRIVISQDGRTIAEFPLTIGVVGTVLAPVLAAIGALAALLTECTIEIERAEEKPGAEHVHLPEASE